jgi:hypothetical protein
MDQADAALISAIELYNKPDSHYREEGFAILALNAWELMLKAKLLDNSRNALKVLWLYERRLTQDGARSTREYVRKNRAGNFYTIGIGEAIRVTPLRTHVRTVILVNRVRALMAIDSPSLRMVAATRTGSRSAR